MHKRHDTFRDKSRKPESKLADLQRRNARHAKAWRLTICLGEGNAPRLAW